MTLRTHPEDRRGMVRVLSERLQTPAIYLRTPTYAFRIGELSINRDGSITGEDESLLESLRPLLIERGWLEEEPVDAPEGENTETEIAGENIHSGIEAVFGAHEEIDDGSNCVENDPAVDLEAQASASVEHAGITTPLRDWTVTERISLLRTLYGRQCLLNRMMQGETLYIEEPFVTAMTDDPPASVADFEARVRNGIEAGAVCGVAFEDGKFIFGTPCLPEEAARWTAYCELLDGVLRSAKAAKRVFLTPHVDPESEKYRANSWLVRMGFVGAAHKELRHTLTSHLNGYAAFKSATDMRAHCEKCAAKRRELREAAQTKDEIENREASE